MDVSVIIPCFNAEAYLAQAIASAIDQTIRPRELIVVDDGSSDGSLSIARAFATAFPGRVRVESCRFGSAPLARNHGAALATGEALMFLDADDVLAPDTVKALTDVLGRVPEGVAIGPWYRLERVDDAWVRRPPSCVPLKPEWDHLDGWLSGWYHPPCSVLWSVAAYRRTGGWDSAAEVNNDGDIMMRALVDGVVLTRAGTGSSFYRRLSADTTTLSGRRFTRSGVVAGLYVYDKIARRLEEQGRVRQYGSSLCRAFEKVASYAAEKYPDLHKEALARADRYRPSWHRRTAGLARDRSAALLQRGVSALRRRLESAPDPDRVKAKREVRFGIDLAESVVRAPTQRSGVVQGAGAPAAPAVTVVIPTYNRSHLITRAVQSVLAQGFTDFEVLIVDDASTDSTAEVVQGLMSGEPRIQYLVQSENKGASAARNRGLAEARGRYIALLDSDDEWLPGKLELQVRYLENAPLGVGMIHGGVETIGPRSWVYRPTQRGDQYRLLLEWNIVHGTSSVVLRQEAVERVGLFDEEMPAIEDWDYWMRVSRIFHIGVTPDPVSRYHDSQQDVERLSLAVDKNLGARDYLFQKHRPEMEAQGAAQGFLMESARRHLELADDHERARDLLLQAVRIDPFRRAPLSRLVTFELQRLLPSDSYRILKKTYRRVSPGR
jgi:O-antigen biosynthesis protein